MNISTWSGSTSSDGYIITNYPITSGDGYNTVHYSSYPTGYWHYQAVPTPTPITLIEKETDLDDVLGWMKRGENIGKMAEIIKMMEEEIAE